jgi:hypothetical protein
LITSDDAVLRCFRDYGLVNGRDEAASNCTKFVVSHFSPKQRRFTAEAQRTQRRRRENIERTNLCDFSAFFAPLR